MKKTQENYFKKKSISKGSYNIWMGKYHERRIEVEKSIPVLEAKLERLNRFGLKLRIPFG